MIASGAITIKNNISIETKEFNILTGGRSIVKQQFAKLQQKNFELQNEKQQLISFIKDKIQENRDKKNKSHFNCNVSNGMFRWS